MATFIFKESPPTKQQLKAIEDAVSKCEKILVISHKGGVEIRKELSRINYKVHSAAHPAKDPDFVRGDGASL